MLLLTRRPGESIKIDDSIDIITIGINGNQVRLGITAPKGISVHREEIYNKILEENNVSSIKEYNDAKRK